MGGEKGDHFKLALVNLTTLNCRERRIINCLRKLGITNYKSRTEVEVGDGS